MTYYKKFDNGLRLMVNKIEGLLSVSAGVIVKTGSINEDEQNNGISHFIEHTVFKGTKKRSSFEISDFIDRIGAQINAFTSKEITCYYTKSIAEHTEDSLEVLSDIFFNSIFDEKELQKEKGVIIEEINMSEDSPEDLCLDVLAQSYYGNTGLGRTILGPAKNVRKFTEKDIYEYMDKYYTADNVVVSLAGNIEPEYAEKLVEKYFANNFTRLKSQKQVETTVVQPQDLYKTKKIEQTHIALAIPAISITDSRTDAFNISSTVLGGGMSSRLFQKIREELGLCYSVYSYPSLYKDSGVMEIYAGVNTKSTDMAVQKIIEEINKMGKDGLKNDEFLRAKEQLKSSYILGKESTASQMILYGKYLLFFDDIYDYEKRLKRLNDVTIDEVNDFVKQFFTTVRVASATVGPKRSSLKIKR